MAPSASSRTSLTPPACAGTLARTLGVMNQLFRVASQAGAIAFLASLQGCAPETVQSRYDTYVLAERNGAIRAGWLPQWLPKTATNVAEIHNIDTNAVMWGATVPLGQEVSLPEGCKAAARSQLPPPQFKPVWWPEPQSWSSPTPGEGFFYFSCGLEYVGFAQEGGKLFGWATAR